MIDPFFLDRLMHAFTTANGTPLSRAALPEATPIDAPDPSSDVPTCRVLREAEAVAAEALHRDQQTHAGTRRVARHD